MKIKSFLTFCAAVAGGVAFASTSGQGYDASLVVDDTPATSFSDTVSGGRTGGQWSPDSSITREDSYYVFDDDSVTNMFVAETTTTDKYVQVVFDLKASPVATAPDGIAADAQTAFCIYNGSFYGYGSGAWQQMTSAVGVPGDDADYKLRLTFDYHAATKYVKFEVATNGDEFAALTVSETNWFATANAATGVSSCAFAGCGSLKELQCLSYSLVAENIEIVPPGGGDPIPMVIPEEAVAAFGNGSAATAATELVKPAANEKTVLENYIVFGQKALDKEITSDTKPVAKIATKTDGAGNIPLSFQNLDVKNVPGTSVSYQLMGAASSGGTFYAVGDPVSSADAVKIPSGTTYKVFKVQVNVNYNSANP